MSAASPNKIHPASPKSTTMAWKWLSSKWETYGMHQRDNVEHALSRNQSPELIKQSADRRVLSTCNFFRFQQAPQMHRCTSNRCSVRKLARMIVLLSPSDGAQKRPKVRAAGCLDTCTETSLRKLLLICTAPWLQDLCPWTVRSFDAKIPLCDSHQVSLTERLPQFRATRLRPPHLNQRIESPVFLDWC